MGPGGRWDCPAPLVSMLLRKEDVEMGADFDFSPLVRSTVGFDRITVRSHLTWQVEKPR